MNGEGLFIIKEIVPLETKFLGIRSYSFFALLGALLAMTVTMFLLYKADEFPIKHGVCMEAGILGLLGGGKAFGILVEILKTIYFKKTFSWDVVLKSGFVSFGGLIGFIAGYTLIFNIETKIIIKKFDLPEGYYICRSRQKSFCFDVMAVGIPLFHSIARFGCLFSGCCYGKIVQTGLCIHYLGDSSSAGYRFPTQLTESFVLFVLFVTMSLLLAFKKWKGKLLYLYIIMYATARFVIEFFRGDEIRGIYFGISTGQITCAALLVFSLLKLLFFDSNKSNNYSTAAE